MTFIVTISGLEDVGHGELCMVVRGALMAKSIAFEKISVAYVDDGTVND